MINREIIRLKIVQITYAYYQNDGKNIDTAEKELFFSLAKAYDLYNYLLLLMVEINRIAVRGVETAQNRYNRIHEGEIPSRKFIENRFINQLEVNKQLLDFQETQKKNWVDEESLVRSLYKEIEATDYYKEYMASPESSYAEDRELWRKIYKNIICNNEKLDSLQVLGIESGETREEALANLYKNNEWIVMNGFSEQRIRCRIVAEPE